MTAIFRWILSRFRPRQLDDAECECREIRTLLIDPCAQDEPTGPAAAGYPVERIRKALARMQRAQTKAELLAFLGQEIELFDLHDIEKMNACFTRKVAFLPEHYRERLLGKVREQIFGAHHRLLLVARNGYEDGSPLHPAFPSYCAMVAAACTEKAREKDPRPLYLKYLLAAFTMFVLEEPAHPVGTPFPGGQIVDVWEGQYLCPVREQAGDVPFALCPYCPAVQSAIPTFPESRAAREESRRRECLANYWTNYKG
ncbi:DUF2115 domain-containing protein [Methanoculleus taiwanensis]|nr:DUF2115 domain-containing protein [Methanoculleus taiwanensis]